MRPIHNNPLNIRKSNDTFLGEYVSDLPFKEFDTMDHGIRAAMVIIRNYVLLHKCKTVSAIINRWAPPSDHNNTKNYIDFVCHHMSCNPRYKFDIFNDDDFVNIIFAMSLFETKTQLDKSHLHLLYKQYIFH